MNECKPLDAGVNGDHDRSEALTAPVLFGGRALQPITFQLNSYHVLSLEPLELASKMLGGQPPREGACVDSKP